MQIHRLVFPDKDRCEVEEAALDEQLAPGEALVRTTSSMISAGTELAMFTRTHRGFDEPDFGFAKYPFHPGYAATGVVTSFCPAESATSSQPMLALGARVFHRGPHATFCKVKQSSLVKLPDDLTDERAVFLGLLQIAMAPLHLAPLPPGAQVVVIGMGVLGNLCAQACTRCGAGKVAVADLSEARLIRARECGLHRIYSVGTKPLAEWARKLAPRGAEYVVEAAGNSRAIADAFKIVADRGTVVLLGSPREKMEFDPYFDIHRKGVKVVGAHERNVDAAARQQVLPMLTEWLRAGKVRVSALVTHKLRMSQAQSAFEGLRDKPDQYMGVILTY